MAVIPPQRQMLTIPRPHVPFGPDIPVDQADADYLRHAAVNIEHARCLGSNLTATVVKLLNDTSDAILASHPNPADPPARLGGEFPSPSIIFRRPQVETRDA